MTRVFECQRCHKRGRSSLVVSMMCEKCRSPMINVTGKELRTFECRRCGKRKRSALVQSLTCSCGSIMSRV